MCIYFLLMSIKAVIYGLTMSYLYDLCIHVCYCICFEHAFNCWPYLNWTKLCLLQCLQPSTTLGFLCTISAYLCSDPIFHKWYPKSKGSQNSIQQSKHKMSITLHSFSHDTSNTPRFLCIFVAPVNFIVAHSIHVWCILYLPTFTIKINHSCR